MITKKEIVIGTRKELEEYFNTFGFSDSREEFTDNSKGFWLLPLSKQLDKIEGSKMGLISFIRGNHETKQLRVETLYVHINKVKNITKKEIVIGTRKELEEYFDTFGFSDSIDECTNDSNGFWLLPVSKQFDKMGEKILDIFLFSRGTKKNEEFKIESLYVHLRKENTPMNQFDGPHGGTYPSQPIDSLNEQSNGQES